MDFGRFPGATKNEATHLGRLAINQPFSKLLDFNQKRAILEEHYDVISDTMDEYLQGKLLKIAIHTYDRDNTSGTEKTDHITGYKNAKLPARIKDARRNVRPTFP